MTGLVLLGVALATVWVLGPYLAQGTAVALTVGGAVLSAALSAALWLAWLAVRPRRALEALRDAVAAAEAETAIRRLNAGR